MIWDSAKLERSVSGKPRLMYGMDAPITSMCRVENTHCLAVAAEDGQLHILRVYASTSGGSVKYGRIECIRTWKAEGKDGHVVSVSHLHGGSSEL
jgi:phosphoinositide-3-kinase regulatory subunit 4